MLHLKNQRGITNIIFLILFLLVISFALLLVSALISLIDQKPPKPNLITKKPSGNFQQELSKQGKIKKFESIEEINDFLEEQKNLTYESKNGFGFGGNAIVPQMRLMAGEGVDATIDIKAEFEQKSDTSLDFSETNIQVEGVDEADIIKTNGNYIYALSKNNIFILKAYPPEKAEILSKIAFKGTPLGMYLNDTKLIIYGNNSQIYERSSYKTLKRRSPFTFFKIFDITNPKEPTQTLDLDFEGNFFNSRMIGDHIYFLTSNYTQYLANETPLPRIMQDSEIIETEMIDTYYFNVPYPRNNFITVAAINIDDNDANDIYREAYLLGGNQNMYVSSSNIYIVYTKYVSEEQLFMEVLREIITPSLPEKTRNKIAEIEKSPNYVLSDQEKFHKINMLIESYTRSLSDDEANKFEQKTKEALKNKFQDISKELEKTIIHKIAINKKVLNYSKTGEVAGSVINQFSMDEQGEYFRIATTKNRIWSSIEEENIEPYNNIYVLDENLKIAGKIEDVAKGERIYSVRFIGSRGYMVTFKQVDPLFVIDLKNPKNPTILGELKVPGFSTYLHPYDENTIIGLGRDTKENEWGGITNGGVKLSLFDVSTPSNIKEIDTHIIGKDNSTNSIALSEHKAFLFSSEKNILAIPINGRENNIFSNIDDREIDFAPEEIKIMPRPVPSKYTNDVYVFGVDKKDGFTLRGKINHGEIDQEIYYYSDKAIKRSFYIEDSLYTFSNNLIKMNNLDDLSDLGEIELEKEEGGDFKVIN